MCICVCVRQREIVSESMIVFHCIQSHLDLIIWFEFSIFSLQKCRVGYMRIMRMSKEILNVTVGERSLLRCLLHGNESGVLT